MFAKGISGPSALFLMLCLATGLRAAPDGAGSEVPKGEAPKQGPLVTFLDPSKGPFGFYRGVLHLAISSGSSDGWGGSLIKHEREVQKGIRLRGFTGQSPLRVFGITDSPIPAFLPVRFNSKPTLQGTIDFALTDNWGVGLTLHSVRIHSIRQEESLNLVRNTGGTYTELFVRSAELYVGQDMMIQGSYHFNERSAFDPYISVRAGAVSFRTDYREESVPTNFLLNLLYPPRGSGTVAGAAAGVNVFFLSQLGLRIELSGYRRWLKSEAFARHSLWTVRLDAGVVFDFNHIAQM